MTEDSLLFFEDEYLKCKTFTNKYESLKKKKDDKEFKRVSELILQDLQIYFNKTTPKYKVVLQDFYIHLTYSSNSEEAFDEDYEGEYDEDILKICKRHGDIRYKIPYWYYGK